MYLWCCIEIRYVSDLSEIFWPNIYFFDIHLGNLNSYYNTQCSLFNWYSTYYSKSLFVTNNFKTLQHYYLLPRTEPETSLPFQNSHKTLTKHACKNGGMEISVLVACRKYYREKRQLIADYRVQSPFWTAS